MRRLTGLLLGGVMAVALGAGALAAGPAEAWRVIGFDGRAWILVSDEPFGHADGHVQARELVLFREPLDGGNGPPITIALVSFDYDCPARLSRRTNIIFIDPKGERLGGSADASAWRDIGENTPAARFGEVVCGQVDRAGMELVTGEPAALRDMLLAR